MRRRKSDRRLHDQNRRLKAQVRHMQAEIGAAIASLGDAIYEEQGPNQAWGHLSAALGGPPAPPQRATPFDNDPSEVF